MKKGAWIAWILTIGLALNVISISASEFKRGDANSDSNVNIADAIYILNYLFAKGNSPTCLDAGDINDDGILNIADSIFLLQYLFNKGKAPNSPFLEKGWDGTFDGLSCGSSAGIVSCKENDLACCKESSVNVIKRQNDKLYCYKVDSSLLKPFETRLIYAEDEFVDEFGKMLVGYDIALKNGDLLMHYSVPGYEKIKESYSEIEAELNSAKTEQEKFSAVLLLFSKVKEESDINVKKEKYGYYLNKLVADKTIGTYEYSEDEDSYNWKIIRFLGLSGINIEEEKTPAYIEFKNLIMQSLDKKIEAGEITRYEVKESNLRYIFEPYIGDAKQESVIVSKIGWSSWMLMDLYSMEDEIRGNLDGLDTKDNEVLFLTESGESFMEKSEADEEVEEFSGQISTISPSSTSSLSSCVDSDGGSNPNTYGSVSFDLILDGKIADRHTLFDDCHGDLKILHEQICNGQIPAETLITCPKYCDSGKCVDNVPSCVDADKGKDYATYSITFETGGAGKTLRDRCKDGDYYTLVEGYCENGKALEENFDCRNLGSDYVCASGKCMKNPYGDVEGVTSSWKFKVPKSKKVTLFIDAEFYNAGFYIVYKETLDILKKEGYEIKKISFDFNEEDFIDFYKDWNSEDGGIVIWVTHGGPGGVAIGKFSNYVSMKNFAKYLESLGFIDGTDFYYSLLGFHLPYYGYDYVSLTKKGIEKLTRMKDLTFYMPCHGSTTKDSVNSKVTYYTRGLNEKHKAKELIASMIKTMAGTDGVKKMSSTNAFDLIKEKSSIFIRRIIENGKIVDKEELILYDHTNPKDRDIILNPVRWHMLNWIDGSEGGASFNGEDYVEVTFASAMASTTSETIEGLVSIESNECPDAKIANLKWGNANGENADTMLSFSIYWDPYCTGSSGCSCNNYGDYIGKIILNSNKLISKENSYFHLNGKKCSDNNLCLKTTESSKEGGRGCVPLGNSGGAVNSCASAIDDFDYFWVRMNEEQNDYNIYEYEPFYNR